MQYKQSTKDQTNESFGKVTQNREQKHPSNNNNKDHVKVDSTIPKKEIQDEVEHKKAKYLKKTQDQEK